MALTEEQLDKIRMVLASAGWKDVIAPALKKRGHEATKALILSRSERAEDYKGSDFDTDDDILRAVIRDCAWMTAYWEAEIHVAEHNRRVDELDRQDPNSTG